MRSLFVAYVALSALAALAACSDSSGEESTERDVARKAEVPEKNDTTGTPPPPPAATTATTCADIAGTYQPVSQQRASGNCPVLPENKNPFVISKSATGTWVIVAGDATGEGTLDTSTCTLHLEKRATQASGTREASMTADYRFTSSTYTAELSLTITGTGTSDCTVRYTESGTKN